MIHDERFVYTLDPPPLGRDSVDEFFFDTRSGYCEHYASAFVFLMRALDIPAVVFRSGASDPNHPRETSEQVAALLPNAQLVEPPWPDTEWNDGGRRLASGGQAGLFANWPLLAPQLLAWADELLG